MPQDSTLDLYGLERALPKLAESYGNAVELIDRAPILTWPGPNEVPGQPVKPLIRPIVRMLVARHARSTLKHILGYLEQRRVGCRL